MNKNEKNFKKVSFFSLPAADVPKIVPHRALTIKEIISRFERGLPIPVSDTSGQQYLEGDKDVVDMNQDIYPAFPPSPVESCEASQRLAPKVERLASEIKRKAKPKEESVKDAEGN